MNTDKIFDAYVECALFTGVCNFDLEATRSPHSYHHSEIAKGTLNDMRSDVNDFVSLLERESVDWQSALTHEELGHDFWLTRNRHGAGFWDRGLDELGNVLTTWAHSYGEYTLYVSDDGKVYGS